jgi:hypothetical protein
VLEKGKKFAPGVQATHGAFKSYLRSSKAKTAKINRILRQFSKNSVTYTEADGVMLDAVATAIRKEEASDKTGMDNFMVDVRNYGLDTGLKSRTAPKKSAEEMEAEWRLAVKNGTSGLGHDITADLFENMEWSEMQVVIRALQCSKKREVPYTTLAEAVEGYKATTSKMPTVQSSVEFPNDGTPSNFVNAFNTVVYRHTKILGLAAPVQEVTTSMMAAEPGTQKTMQGFIQKLYEHTKVQELMALAVPFKENLRAYCAQNDQGGWAPKKTDEVSFMAQALMLLVGYDKKLVLHADVGGTKTVRIQKITIGAQSTDPAKVDGTSSDGKMPETTPDAGALEGVSRTNPKRRRDDSSSESESESDDDDINQEGSADGNQNSDQFMPAPATPQSPE